MLLGIEKRVSITNCLGDFDIGYVEYFLGGYPNLVSREDGVQLALGFFLGESEPRPVSAVGIFKIKSIFRLVYLSVLCTDGQVARVYWDLTRGGSSNVVGLSFQVD